MALDVVKKESSFQAWVEHPASHIVHHDARCCEEARMWFLGYARSMQISALSRYELRAPTWLSQLFTWGPSAWPIAWCELVKMKTLDCGVFAALAREAFTAQGFEAHPAQALLSFNPTCTTHWKGLWKKPPKNPLPEPLKDQKKEKTHATFPWIGNEVVYHELCVLEMEGNQAKFYDSTWGNWFTPDQETGFGALLALRTECPRLLHWGDKIFSYGEWIDL